MTATTGATTKEQLVLAATALLDRGGQDAVTLRAVAHHVGVSHNTPYRHFRDRSALLAGVAERDFEELRREFENASTRHADPVAALRAAAGVLIDYAHAHGARYRLLFSDPGLVPGPSLQQAALGSFHAFGGIVERCQQAGVLPDVGVARLTGLIYAALHGAIDLELGGRAQEAKGLGTVAGTIDLLLRLLAPGGATRA